MRKLTDHIIAGKVHCNTISVMDEPGDGGACHQYLISLLGKHDSVQGTSDALLTFQNGPIDDQNPPNGIHGEDLIAICIDRLRGFQSGQFACRDNAIALTHLEDALMWLQKRTRDRMARGV